MSKIKIFRQKVTDQYWGKVSDIEAEFNNWVSEKKPDIKTVQVSSFGYNYTWVPVNTRGEFDHEKRSVILSTITVLYD